MQSALEASDQGAAGARRGDLLVLLGAARPYAYGADDLAVPHERDAAGVHHEMSSGCPISSDFRSAASMTRRASPDVTVSLVFATSAV